MDQQQGMIFALIMISGIPLLGMGAYMYDKLQKSIPREDRDSGIFNGQIKLFKVLLICPFKYLIFSFKKRNIKGVILSLAFFTILISVSIIGNSKLVVG